MLGEISVVYIPQKLVALPAADDTGAFPFLIFRTDKRFDLGGPLAAWFFVEDAILPRRFGAELLRGSGVVLRGATRLSCGTGEALP